MQRRQQTAGRRSPSFLRGLASSKPSAWVSSWTGRSSWLLCIRLLNDVIDVLLALLHSRMSLSCFCRFSTAGVCYAMDFRWPASPLPLVARERRLAKRGWLYRYAAAGACCRICAITVADLLPLPSLVQSPGPSVRLPLPLASATLLYTERCSTGQRSAGPLRWASLTIRLLLAPSAFQP